MTLTLPDAVGVHDEDVGVPGDGARVGDLRAVGRPRGLLVGRRVGRQPREVVRVDAHHVDLAVAVAVAREGDPQPVGGDRRHGVGRRVLGHPPRRRPVGVHPVDLEIAVAARLEDDAADRCRDARDHQVGPVARVQGARSRVAREEHARLVLQLHAHRAPRCEAEVVHRVAGAEWVPELEGHASVCVRHPRDHVLRAAPGRVRAQHRPVAVVACAGTSGRAVVEVAVSAASGHDDGILAGVLDAVVVVVEEERCLLRADAVVVHVQRAVEVPAGMLEPHRADHAAEVHGIGRRVRPLARVDLPVDVGRSRGDERLELDRRRVMSPRSGRGHQSNE